MIGVISINKQGDAIARKIISYYDDLKKDVKLVSKVLDANFNLKESTKNLWNNCEAIIIIGSTGIAVRAIASLVEHKSKDPAIIVIDVNELFVISLLSGHLGGANEYTYELSKLLGSTAVITTATDNIGVEAPDLIAKRNSLIIEDYSKIKIISSALVNREEVYFKDDENLISIPKGYKKTDVIRNNLLWVTNKLNDVNYDESTSLRLIRRNVVLGIGCRKNISSSKLLDFVLKTLEENNIDRRAVIKIGSIDIKKEEKAIVNLAKSLNSEFITFSKEEIKEVQHNFEGSDFVEKSIGVRAVCEPAVLLLHGKILLEKSAFEGMTISIGELA
ncbi:cobalt-precorrin 5A hydrolase [Clostridium massiliamazoniense]|uniref:cobalt-precorrin 5A hydrolase n=1 Tax=Clostridium massiliamazoniense TaxID=1347366 RepID=UPI0006D78178|nr:cobalt-precorrin 5A hydrolase [Clostridium massiliamazoniense]